MLDPQQSMFASLMQLGMPQYVPGGAPQPTDPSTSIGWTGPPSIDQGPGRPSAGKGPATWRSSAGNAQPYMQPLPRLGKQLRKSTGADYTGTKYLLQDARQGKLNFDPSGQLMLQPDYGPYQPFAHLDPILAAALQQIDQLGQTRGQGFKKQQKKLLKGKR